MWPSLFWADGFFPPDTIGLDLVVSIKPAWLLRRATRSPNTGRWSWTVVKR